MNVARSALLPYSTAQMFAVVSNVEAYPEFLNWCSGVEVLQRANDELTAKMHIAYGKLRFSFSTRNVSEPDRSIDLSLVEGPFTNFSGRWEFLPLQSNSPDSSEACKISLQMAFDFDRGLASVMLGKMFEKIAAAQLDAFQQRASELYTPAEFPQ